MSGIAAIYNVDGRPADHELFGRMMALIAHRGGDASGSWIDGPIALGYQQFCTTPESVHERQPVADPSGRLHLVFDGRVDNREELAEALAARGVILRDNTDAELVLRTYECWGGETPYRILGDFCMVVWDAARRELFCARDICAVRKLYYYWDGRSFICGAELIQILADPRVPRDPDEGTLGEYMAGEVKAAGDTLYRHIKKLPAAFALTVSAAGLVLRRYFDLGLRQLRYRNDAEYAEHFAEIFREAIRCRTRVIGPYGIHLSGGLDSTSIAGMAVAMSRGGDLAPAPFETYSMLFDEPDTDERSYVFEAAAMLGVKANYVQPLLLDLATVEGSVCRFKEYAEYPNGAIWYPLWREARGRGIRVLIGGTGSDEWMGGSRWFYADLLRQGHWRELWRRIQSDSRTADSGGGFSVALAYFGQRALWPLLPLALRKPIRRLRGQKIVPSFIRPAFARRNALWDRLQVEPHLPGSTFSQHAFYDSFVSGWTMHGREGSDRSAAVFGVEERYPFLDRRLIEFLMAIPDDQRVRHDERKFVMRQALRGKIPDSIYRRQDKAIFSMQFIEALSHMGGERLFDRMALAEAGWIDRPEFLRAYRLGMADYTSHNLWPLWNTFAAEIWYRLAYLNEAPQTLAAGHPAQASQAQSP
ncbi:MAG: asparagine synthase-related protein [Candidatus Binataceae bacterium]|jgi:asparagine synthase (glutamine-hydrolysing)